MGRIVTNEHTSLFFTPLLEDPPPPPKTSLSSATNAAEKTGNPGRACGVWCVRMSATLLWRQVLEDRVSWARIEIIGRITREFRASSVVKLSPSSELKQQEGTDGTCPFRG